MNKINFRLQQILLIPFFSIFNVYQVSEPSIEEGSGYDIMGNNKFVQYSLVMQEIKKVIKLPSGNRCRVCSSEVFELHDSREYNSRFDKPVICEEYICVNCGNVTENWRYFDATKIV